jgi:hypothetical protein
LQAMGEVVSDRRQALGTEPENLFQPAVVGGVLEVFQRSDSEVVVNAVGQLGPDARHGREEACGIAVAAQPLQHRQPPARQQIADGPGDALPDAWERLQPGKPLPFEHVGYRGGQPPDRSGGALVRAHPEPVRTLRLQQARKLIEPVGDVPVLPLGVHEEESRKGDTAPRAGNLHEFAVE